MKLHQLHLLCALAQEHTFTAVSEKMFVAQPALSTSMRALEQELGCTLLTRSNQGVQFTAEGRLALEKAQHILQCISNIRTIAENAQRQPSGELIIGSNTQACLEILFDVLLTIEAQYPQIALHFQEIDEDNLLHQLAYGLLDFALLQVNTLQQPKEEFYQLLESYHLSFTALRTEPMVVMLRRKHPLGSQIDISIAALAHYPFVTAHRDTDRYILSALEAQGCTLPALFLQDITCLEQFISASDHWALVPQSEAQRHQAEADCPFAFFKPTDFLCQCTIGWLRPQKQQIAEEHMLLAILRKVL